MAVTGASGFIGRHLIRRLLERQYRVVALSRRPDLLQLPDVVDRRAFDPNGAPKPEAFRNVDAVVHLAGESVAGRWTEQKKLEIYDSRISGTQCVVHSMAQCDVRPGILLCASGSGYYGDRGDEALTEASGPGNDFLAKVCADWELTAMAAANVGTRVACFRTGVVLGEAGALAKMQTPFKLGLGGPLGNGRQFFPWIHIDDLVDMYMFALETPSMAGPINAVTPDYSTSARFAQALGAAVGRPAIVPVPAPPLKVLLGEFARTLLGSQLIVPTAAQEAGFTWRHPRLEDALANILSPDFYRPSPVRRFVREQLIDAPVHRVFEFFSDPRNLQHITPPLLQFQIQEAPQALARGSQIDYSLRLRGVKFGWKTMIAQWEPPHAFTDVQLHGPYALWQHTHTFQPHMSGTKMTDEVLYALPFTPFSAPVVPMVQRDIEAIFDYRRDRIGALLQLSPALSPA